MTASLVVMRLLTLAASTSAVRTTCSTTGAVAGAPVTRTRESPALGPLKLPYLAPKLLRRFAQAASIDHVSP